MAKVKIVRIIARLNIGGPAVNASILSSALDVHGFSTTLVYGSLARGEGSLEHLVAAKGIRSVVVPELGREISLLDDLRAFMAIMRIIKAERPDIVHTHTAKAGTLGRLAAALCGVKVRVHTYHGHVFRHYFGRLKTALYIRIERFLGALTDKVVVLSLRQRHDIVDIFKIVPAGKCSIVPLGLDKSRFSVSGMRSDLRKELGVAPGTVVVGIVGRLVPIKNHALFIEAAAEVKRTMPRADVRYLIIGDGELASSLKARVEVLGLSSSVHFLGWRDDLAAIYDAVDIMALTSRNEGTPLAFIEAMAYGKAIIATNVGGVSDLVENGVNGILVPEGDLQQFALRLAGLIADKGLRDRLGGEGRKKCAVFTEENLASTMAALYRQCLEEKG